MKIVTVEFYGIDFWNRPIFKDVECKDFYGSVVNLYDHGEEDKAYNFYKNENMLNTLCYFGQKFNCEPLGLSLKDMNIKLKLSE